MTRKEISPIRELGAAVPEMAELPGAALAAAEDGHDDHDHENEVVTGTNQADEITTGGGPQTIYGGNGGDTIRAGGGPDLVFGENGKDTVVAGGGPDEVSGGNGNDILFGACGPDILDGGNGADVLTGGVAADLLTGGRGPDRFVYLAASDAPGHGGGHAEADGGGHEGDHGGDHGDHGGPSVETITDFEPGLDVFDLTAIGTVTGLSDGPEAYSVWVEQVGEDVVVRVETDGNMAGEHPEDMTILLLETEAEAISAGDFLF